jgi:hypothetical protein
MQDGRQGPSGREHHPLFSEHAALPVRRTARGRALWRIGGLAEPAEQANDGAALLEPATSTGSESMSRVTYRMRRPRRLARIRRAAVSSSDSRSTARFDSKLNVSTSRESVGCEASPSGTSGGGSASSGESPRRVETASRSAASSRSVSASS